MQDASSGSFLKIRKEERVEERVEDREEERVEDRKQKSSQSCRKDNQVLKCNF